MDNGYNQYNQPQMGNYNPYGQQQFVSYNPYGEQQPTAPGKGKFITLSMILGLLGSVLLLIGLLLPAIDFSHFHQEVDIQYNLFKIGKNVGLISAMWNVIPYAILVGIILLVILSFIKIPVLKILPVLLIICMFVLMLVDMGNLAQWTSELIEKVGITLEVEITTEEIFKSLMPGIYIMVSGLVIAIISCFVTIKEK